MKRLNIYFIHSNKLDYNNLIYKKVLASSVCLSHDLVLPMTQKYQEKYTKELIENADIIIAEVSNPTFGLILELRWLCKQDKPKLYLSLDNKIPRKCKKYVPKIVETTDETYITEIEKFINENAVYGANKDNVITLGQI